MDDEPIELRPQVRRCICTLCGVAYVEAGSFREGQPPENQLCADCRMLPPASEDRETTEP